jgi:hypothetical protein
MTLTPQQRSESARRAALIRWAREPDRTAATRAAREAAYSRFEAEVDPEGVLPPAERRKRALSLQAAHMIKMRLSKRRKAWKPKGISVRRLPKRSS